MDNLESRIRALEASNRRQRYSITALAGIIVGGAFIAATRPDGDATFDTVTCKAWKVVDNDGKPRISTSTSATGEAATTWHDKDGKTRIGASTDAAGVAATALYDNDGTPRIGAGTLADGTAATTWLDKDGKIRISTSTNAAGVAATKWHDKDGKTRIGAGTLADGTVILPTSDLQPKP